MKEYCSHIEHGHEVLSRLGLADKSNDQPLTLALGDQRMVEVARALTVGASFVLLDEPFAGLAENERKSVASLLRWLVNAHGIGILLVEHNLDVVRAVGDDVVVMDQGRLLIQGPPEEVLADPMVRRAYFGENLSEGE